MDTTIKTINYRVRPPENRDYGWIDRETLKVFNGWEWVAVGADSPFHKSSSLENIDGNFHKLAVTLKDNQALTFAKPFVDGAEMTIVITNGKLVGAIEITLPEGNDYLYTKAERTISLNARKSVIVKTLCIGDRMNIEWTLEQ